MKKYNNRKVQILKADVQNRLIKVFVEKGFSCIPLLPEEICTELKKAFPFGRLKRERDGRLEIVEIQFDKYGRPRFIINFGIVPNDGVLLPWGDYLDRDKADVSALPEAYRLYSSAFFSRWFEIGIFSKKTEDASRKVIDKAISISSEVEEWFVFKSVGKHMRKFGLYDLN